ncbi:hypothetical protein BDZ45DRAFT_748882 [Acephala macrosclerotiorum]|nr:hypothetical protein BDZ45DRAFT_748882 [Acephala macrosclerotiorum]
MVSWRAAQIRLEKCLKEDIRSVLPAAQPTALYAHGHFSKRAVPQEQSVQLSAMHAVPTQEIAPKPFSTLKNVQTQAGSYPPSHNPMKVLGGGVCNPPDNGTLDFCPTTMVHTSTVVPASPSRTTLLVLTTSSSTTTTQVQHTLVASTSVAATSSTTQQTTTQSALVVSTSVGSVSTTLTGTTSSIDKAHHTSSIVKVVGGTIGAVGAILLLIAALWRYCKKCGSPRNPPLLSPAAVEANDYAPVMQQNPVDGGGAPNNAFRAGLRFQSSRREATVRDNRVVDVKSSPPAYGQS